MRRIRTGPRYEALNPVEHDAQQDVLRYAESWHAFKAKRSTKACLGIIDVQIVALQSKQLVEMIGGWRL
jgi:hypothetical protein